MRISRRLGGLAAAGALALSVGTALPAFAAGNPVAITATVNQTITMTGPPASLALSGNPGTTATGNVAYTVTTNDASGYTVTVTPGGTALVNGGNTILNGSMGYVPNGGTQVNFSGSTPLTVVNKSTFSGGSGDP